MELYQKKYLKYKQKYVDLKRLIGGGSNNQQHEEVTITLIQMSGKSIIIPISQNETIYAFREKVAVLMKNPIYSIKLMRGTQELQGKEPIYIPGLDNNNNDISLVIVNTNPTFTISAGTQFSAAIMPDKTAICWGYNSHGQVSNIPELGHDESFTMISTGYNHTVALTSQNRVVCWGADSASNILLIPELTINETFTMISAGTLYTVALTSQNRVIYWGENSNRYISKIPTLGPDEYFTMISAGGYYTAAITSKGRAFCWGWDDKMSKIPKLRRNEHFTMISAGTSHIAAITSEGRAICWGNNDYGQVTSIPELEPVYTGKGTAYTGKETDEYFTMISAGDVHTAAITSHGRALCWGNNKFLSKRHIITNPYDPNYNPYDYQNNINYNDDNNINNIPRLSKDVYYKEISAGSLHTIAISTDNKIHCWGKDEFGEVNDIYLIFNQSNNYYNP